MASERHEIPDAATAAKQERFAAQKTDSAVDINAPAADTHERSRIVAQLQALIRENFSLRNERRDKDLMLGQAQSELVQVQQQLARMTQAHRALAAQLLAARASATAMQNRKPERIATATQTDATGATDSPHFTSLAGLLATVQDPSPASPASSRQQSLSNTTCSNVEWVLDSEVQTCQNATCTAAFGLFRRRHHCRACGRIFCAAHSRHTLLLATAPNSPTRLSRACDECATAYVAHDANH